MSRGSRWRAIMGRGLLQPTHLFFILLIVLVIFGPGRLPELGRSLGKGIREFKDALSGRADAKADKAGNDGTEQKA